MERFPVRIDMLWRLPVLLLGAAKRYSYAELREDGLLLRLGLVKVTVPYADIESAEDLRWPWYAGIGVRIGPEGVVGLVGSFHGVVKLRLRRPAGMKAIWTFPASSFAVSLEDPAGFRQALAQRLPKA